MVWKGADQKTLATELPPAQSLQLDQLLVVFWTSLKTVAEAGGVGKGELLEVEVEAEPEAAVVAVPADVVDPLEVDVVEPVEVEMEPESTVVTVLSEFFWILAPQAVSSAMENASTPAESVRFTCSSGLRPGA